MKKKSIRVPLESWLYLQNECKKQRCGGEISTRFIEMLTKEYNRYDKNGHVLVDGDLGGAIGNPENSYEEGRWTSWSIEQMKKMLDEKALPYQDGEEVDETPIYFKR